LPFEAYAESVFERFTDRARRVLVLAQEEARLLNHGFIGTEHILLGLIHEGDGPAARALAQLDISLEKVRARVEEAIGLSGTAPTGSPPFTPRAKKVLELSLREALQLGHNYIGTEHMLLGLVSEGEGVGAQVLVSLGADMASVRQHVIQLLPGVGESQRLGATWVAHGPIQRDLRPSGGTVRWHPTCSFCGRDLWEVGRYVSAGPATICEDCTAAAVGALKEAKTTPGGEIPFPPRLFGTAPDDRAVDEVVAVLTFLLGDTPIEHASLSDAIEDADELEPYLQEAGRRHSVRPSAVRVERLRFLDDDTAEVEFVIQLHGGQGFSITGNAVRRDDRWFISRETVARVLQLGGIVVPPRPPAQ
jgi:hypothetical protein